MRSIRRWRSQGAPLDNERALTAWIASRRSAPRAGGPTPPPPPSKPTAPASPPAGGLEGLRGSVARLAAAEVEAREDYRRARLAGDASEKRLAERAWLEISEALRRAHLSLTETEREAGDFVARVEVERLLTNAGRALGLLGFELTQGLAGEVARQTEPGAIIHLLRTAFDSRIRLALANPADAPPWLRRAFVMGAALGPGAEDWTENFATLARAFVRTHDASVLEAARRAELEHEMRARIWADSLTALRRGDLDEVASISLGAWNQMRADLGLPPRPRGPTGAEITRAREMRLAGTLAPEADVPLDP